LFALHLKAWALIKIGVDMARLEIVGTKLPSEVVKEVVLDSLNMRLKDVEEIIVKLQDLISEFERKYGFLSEEFLKKWRSNQLEDSMDFFEWETCLAAIQNCQRKEKP